MRKRTPGTYGFRRTPSKSDRCYFPASKLGLLLFIYSFVIVTRVSAQYSTFGGRAGVNFANFYGDIKENRSKIGPSAGAFYTYVFRRNFGVTAEAFLSMQGVKRDSVSFFNTTTFAVNHSINYFQVPVMLTYFNGVFNRRTNLIPKGFVGPQFGYRINAKKNYETNNGEVKRNMSKQTSPFNVDMVVGLGLHFKLHKYQWGWVDARYNFGLTNVLKNSKDSWKSSIISLNVGLALPNTRYYKGRK